MLKSNISLVKKNDSWVPRKEQQLSAIEKHGYNLTKTLGEGAYAKVKLADSKKHNSQVAIKVINKRRAPKDFLKKFLPREVHLMHRLDHPNVIKLYEVVETPTKVYLVLQLASKGDLLEYINSKPLLGEDEVRMLFCQLAAAMAYCHKEHVVHRDLKCENILIGGDGKLKVSDFGFAINTIKNRLLETFCGSYAYCCPQILRGEPYDGKKADVWSMGVVLYALGCARLPFSENDMQALIHEDFTNKIKFSKRVSKEYRDLVRWMLSTDQDKRATAEQTFRSPWCMKAIKDHPELSYLEEYLNPVLVRKPSECAPQEADEFEEEAYPVDVKQVHAKIGEKPNRGVVTCFTFAAPAQVAKQKDKGRRHTISGFEIHDKSYRMSLRDDLLRSLAQKEMKSRSLHKVEEEKKELPKESYNRHQTRRRSTVVTDVLTAASPSTHKPGERKASLVSDVIKFDPKTASRRGSVAEAQKDAKKAPSKLGFVKPKQTATTGKRGQMPGGRQSRLKEIAKLKYTSAARAAKMAYREAHISMTANRRLSLQAPDHYVTIRCVEKLHEFQDRNDKMEKNTSVKFKNWQKKFKIGLEQNV